MNIFMKTKIVYVLVSDERDLYLEQAWLSLYSLRLHNPTTHVVVLVDDNTERSLIGKRRKFCELVTEIKTIDVPAEYTAAQRSRYIKTTARRHVVGNFLFIDTDTIVTDTLDDLDDMEIEIGAVPEFHVDLSHFPGVEGLHITAQQLGWSYDEKDIYNYNSGAIFVKDTPVAHQFYQMWSECWLKSMAILHRHHDQPPLAMADHLLDHPIVPMNGIWNCQILERGIFYLPSAKVVHYFGTSLSKDKDDYIYAFEGSDILYEVKNLGGISKSIHQLLVNAKGICNSHTQIVAGMEADLLYTHVYRVVKNLYKYHSSIFHLLDNTLKCFGKMKSKFK